MPEPIEYQIVLNLQTALRAITTSSGYYYTVQATAVKFDLNVEVEALIGANALRPFIVIEVLPESREYHPAKRTTLKTPINIHWVSDAVESNDTARMQTFFRGVADVERAIAVDVSRGGLAKDQLVLERELWKTLDGGQVWAIVKTQIENRRVYGAP